MSNRNKSENSEATSLIPFLAVMLCTMGTLLVLLVVLVQRAAHHASQPAVDPSQLLAVEQPPVPIPVAVPTPVQENADDQERLKEELEQVAAYQQQLKELKDEANKRLEQERAKLSHSEEHMRRLQEELAKLSIADEQLKQTEANQTIDQEQAKKEADRLEQLVIDTTKQLEVLREDAPQGKRSYAIIPYKGQNGTYRKPIYIECSSKGVVLHPEGLVLSEEDFLAPNWPGNPLASALRASREYLNNKAAADGAPEPPDPYPLLIVRPSGIKAYALARTAISSWDSDYGYEFVEEDMKLSFPEAPDPQLARAQHHAVMNSRERLVHLVQSAPSRFPGMKMSGSGMGGSGTGQNSGAYGSGNGEYGSEGSAYASIGSKDGQGMGSGGNGYAAGGQPGEEMSGNGSMQPGESQIGAMTGDGTGNGIGKATSGSEGAQGQNGEQASGEKNSLGQRYAQQTGTGQGPGGSQASGATTNAPSEPINGKDTAGGGGGSQQTAGTAGSSGGSGGAAGAGQGATSGGTPSMNFSNTPSQPIAESRGANWAVNEPRQKAVAISRPISVVVRENKMIIMPTGFAKRGPEATGKEIALDQSINDISNNFKKAVHERIDEWGMAGSGMYWKPVLELHVEENASMTATRIVHLLKGSGVEVQLPATANAGATGSPRSGGTTR